MTKACTNNRQRVRLLAALALSVVVLACIAIGVRAAWFEVSNDFTPRYYKPTIPATSSIRAGTAVTFTSANGEKVAAWWLPGNRRHAVILIHGSDAGRDQLIPEGEILSEHGFSVLLLDLPGHGESHGNITWGHAERQAVGAALDYVNSQQPAAHVGVYAFSMGAMIAAQVAAADSRVRALVLAGVAESFEAQVMREYAGWGWLSKFPALWGARLAGYRANGLAPVDAVAKAAAVMVVAGTADPVVPYHAALRVFDAARPPKELLRVSGGHHGDYLETLGRERYAHALTTFFTRYLEGSTSSSRGTGVVAAGTGGGE